MTEQTNEKKPRRKLLITVVSIATILAMALPMIVMAQDETPVDMDGTYFVFRTPRSASDIDGTSLASTYQGVALLITEQADEQVVGLVLGLNVTRIRGAVATGDTADIDARRNRAKLAEGETEFAVSGNGTINVYLPDGVVGVATAANLTSTPVELSPGDNELTFTAADTAVSVEIWSDYEVLAEVSGVVGTGRRANLVLAGTHVVTFLDETGDFTATIDGLTLEDDLHRVAPPGGAFVVSGAGTFGVYMPYGCYGTVTGSGGLEIDGDEAQDLVPGEWTTFDTGITTGNLHVNVASTMLFQLSASARSRNGEVAALRGNIEGFIVLDRDPWNVAILSMKARSKALTYCLGD